jgi:hypothetical protein
VKLTFVDADVLIAAARGGSVQATRAMNILDDPDREFAGPRTHDPSGSVRTRGDGLSSTPSSCRDVSSLSERLARIEGTRDAYMRAV